MAESTLRDEPTLGFSVPLTLLFWGGAVLLAIGGLLRNIASSGGGGGPGDAAGWLVWLGVTALAVALSAAGLTGRGASAGVRVALLAVGALLFVASVGGSVF